MQVWHVLCLRFARLNLLSLLLVPQPALVLGPSTQVPRLDEQPLCLVHVVLILHFLHADLEAIFGEHHVLRLHLIGRGFRDLGHGQIHMVANEGCAGKDNEENKHGQ